MQFLIRGLVSWAYMVHEVCHIEEQSGVPWSLSQQHQCLKKSLHRQSILLQCSTEVADKHAGMCRRLVQMSLFSVSLPVAKGPLSWGLYCFGMWWEAAPCVSLPCAAYSGCSFYLCANSTIDHSVVLQVAAARCGCHARCSLLWLSAGANTFFFFLTVPQQIEWTPVLPFIMVFNTESHSADNKVLFLKIGGAAKSPGWQQG